MKPEFFGDSYDIVKQSLLRWLKACGPWVTHPMLTEAMSDDEAEAYSGFLGVPLLSREVLGPWADRDAYFAAARGCQAHVFVDPDTGIHLEGSADPKAPSFLFGPELLAIAGERPEHLTLIFDQAFDRSLPNRDLIDDKLDYMVSSGLSGIAYVAHSCFFLIGSRPVVGPAFDVVQAESKLPADRFMLRMTPDE